MVTDRRQFCRLAAFVTSFVLLGVGLPLVYLTQPLHFDEAVYLTIADQMAQGKVLYGDVYDHKPPGVFYLALAVERFVTTFDAQLQFLAYGDAAVSDGLSVYVLRLLTYGATATTGILVYELGRRLYDRTAGMGASLLFLTGMYLPHFVGFYFLTEQWAILTTVAATVLLLNDRAVSDVFAGFALGIGVLFNQTVFLFGLAFVVFRALQFRYRYNRSRDYLDATLRRFGLIGAGFAVPVSFVLAAFYARGLLSELLYYTVYLPLFTYSPPFTMRGRLLAFLSFLLVWLLAIGMIVRVGVSLVRGQHLETPIRSSSGQLYRDGGSYRGRNRMLFVALWALFVSYPGVRGFNAQHQLLFVFPPVALLAVGELRRLLDATWQHLYVDRVSAGAWQSRSPVRYSVVGVLVVCLVISAGFNGVYASNTLEPDIDEQVASAEAVDERVDGVTYTWAPQQSHLYYFSDGIEPAPTFFGPVYSQAMSDQVVHDIEQSEVEYVVVQKSFVDDGEILAANSKWFADEKDKLVAYLNRQYEPVDETDGYVIFRRVES